MQLNLNEDHLQDMSAYLKDSLSAYDAVINTNNGLIIVEITAAQLLNLLEFLKSEPRVMFTMLSDLSAVDYPERVSRFEVIYNLLSLKHNLRAIVKMSLAEDELAPSIHHLYSAAIWYEREVWDMYGISFESNPDLRRILTDYGFEGHPQRKDFPLTGYVEVHYDEVTKKVIYAPVKLNQEFRNFDFLSPWEGPNYTSNPDEAK